MGRAGTVALWTALGLLLVWAASPWIPPRSVPPDLAATDVGASPEPATVASSSPRRPSRAVPRSPTARDPAAAPIDAPWDPRPTSTTTPLLPPALEKSRPRVGRIDPAPVPLTGHPEGVRLLLQWAATDPAAATLWADRLPDPAERQEALQAVCFKIAEKDPGAALDMAETYDLGAKGGSVFENLTAQWSAKDADAALAWALQRAPGRTRDGLIARVAFGLSTSQPAEAARLVEELMAPGSRQDEAAASVVHQWSLRDAPAAAGWVEGLPPGPLRDRAQRELAHIRAP